MEKTASSAIGNATTSRRSFLKGAAALAGLATIAPAAAGCATTSTPAKVDESGDQVYQGLCRGNCGGGCRIEVKVREGKVISTGPTLEEDPMDFLICPRGLSHIQRMYAPERIQYPVRRKEGTPRGGGEWERLTWDEAINYVTGKWKEYRAKYGNNAIAFSYGAGTYSNDYFVYQRFFNSIGAINITQENDMTMLNYSWKIYGMSLYMVGDCKTGQADSKTVFIWGCNATIGTFNRWKYLMAARDKGAKLVVIDPTYTCAAQKADLWVPIKPGTDAALALCMMKYWHDNGLDAKDYLRDLTVAPYLVRQDTGKFMRADDAGIEAEAEAGAGSQEWGGAVVAGDDVMPIVAIDEEGNPGLLKDIANPQIEGTFEVNGIKVKTAYQMLIERCAEWTLEATAKKCDLSVELIEKLCLMYLDGPTMLHTGFGLDHRGSGDGSSHAICVLPLVSGQVGFRGAGIAGNLAGATTANPFDNWNIMGTSHYTPGMKTVMKDVPLIVEKKRYNGQDVNLKSIYFYVSNPLGSYGGSVALRKAFDQVELIVYAEQVWNDTAKYADVVLPVPHWFEYETYRTCPSSYCDFNDAAVPPQFESKPDTEIVAMLGKAMGLNEPYGEFNFDNDSILRTFFESESALAMGLSYDLLKQVKHIRVAPYVFPYGSRAMPWQAENGRALFYFDNVEPEFNKEAPIDKWLYALPFQRNDNEAYEGNPLAEKYPINLMTHRDKFKVHTAFAKSPWLLEIQPEPTVEMNPIDAEKYGVAEGDLVKCYNDRGFCVFRLHLDPSMRPGTAWTEHTWLDDQYVAGHYADLTPLESNDFFPTNTPFDTLVAVEVWKEA